MHTWEQHVHELAVGGPGAHLLDLGEPGVEAVVDPGQHVVAGQVVRRHGRRVHVHRHPEKANSDCHRRVSSLFLIEKSKWDDAVTSFYVPEVSSRGGDEAK